MNRYMKLQNNLTLKRSFPPAMLTKRNLANILNFPSSRVVSLYLMISILIFFNGDLLKKQLVIQQVALSSVPRTGYSCEKTYWTGS